MKHYLKYYKEQILSMMIVSYKTVSLSYNHKIDNIKHVRSLNLWQSNYYLKYNKEQKNKPNIPKNDKYYITSYLSKK